MVHSPATSLVLPTASPATAADEPRGIGRGVVVAAAVGVASVRWWTASPRRVFHINPDEPAQLAIARFVGRSGRWDMFDHSTWRPGYGLLISPLTRLFTDPELVLRAALTVNAVLGGLSCLLLIWLARRLTDLPPRWCVAAAVVVSLTPALLFTTAFVWSESLVQAVFLTFLIAAVRFQETMSPWWGAAMVLAAASGFVTHTRLLVLSVVAVALIVAAGTRGRTTIGVTAALLTACAVALLAVEAVSRYVVALVWDDPSPTNTAGGVLAQVGPGTAILTSATGQLWYQLTTTLGLTGVGVVVLARRWFARGARAASAAADAAIVLATTGSLFALSVVFMADRWRPDQVVYGRYTDAVIAPTLLVGLAWLISAGRRAVVLAAAGVAVAVVATGFAVETSDRGQLQAPGLVRAMVIGLLPFIGSAAAIEVSRATAWALVALAAIVVTRQLARDVGAKVVVGLLLAVLVSVGYARTRPVIDLGLNAWRTGATVTASRLPAGAVVRIRLVPDSEHPAISRAAQRFQATLYQFYLPANHFVLDDDETAQLTPFVFAPVHDEVLTMNGARMVWRDPLVPMALWVEPPSSCSSTTCMSASSTPPPVSSSAPSPSTPTAATTAPDDHAADLQDPEKRNPTNPDAGSAVSDVLRHHTGADEGNRTPVFSLGS